VVVRSTTDQCWYHRGVCDTDHRSRVLCGSWLWYLWLLCCCLSI
jgi:hypothetical protein